MRVHALPAGGEHLVGGDGDRPHLLDRAGVLADLVLGEGGAAQQLGLPLPGRLGVGHEDQRGGLLAGHRPGAHQGLAGAAGQHHHAGAAVGEPVHGVLLVGAQLPVALQRDGVGLAVDVAGLVVGGPAGLDELALERAALGGVHGDRVVVHAGTQHRGDFLLAGDLGEHRAVGGVQHQPGGGVLLQGEAAVAVHRLGDVHQQRLRHREAAVAHQGVHDRLGVQSRGARVPQGQRGDAVGVHVLRRALQLGERRDGAAGGLVAVVVYLEEHGLVALDDEGTGHGGDNAAAGRAVPWQRVCVGCGASGVGPGARPGAREGSPGTGKVLTARDVSRAGTTLPVPCGVARAEPWSRGPARGTPSPARPARWHTARGARMG